MDYPTYANMRKLIHTPDEAYRQQFQALLNERWYNSTQTSHPVYQQDAIGSDSYTAVDISMDTAIDIGTGFKKGDDFKVFSYRDITVEVPLGIMYKTEHDYWICINTSDLASSVNSYEVRRCNNILKWIDPQTGYLHQQWCNIDYELSSPQPQKDKDVVVANGHIFVTVQGNEETWKIRKNQRFIFSGQPYKVAGIQSLLYNYGQELIDSDENTLYATLLYIDLYLDPIEPSDDLVNNIANATEYVYEIDLQPDVFAQTTGFVGQMAASVSLNGEAVERELVWSGNDYVTVLSDGSYELIGEIGDRAEITVSVNGNPNLSATCTINIVDAIEDKYDIVITPMFDEVVQNVPQEFSVYLYKNGEEQDDAIIVTASGAKPKCYTLTQSEHTFTLSVRDVSDDVLSLTFSAGDTTKTIDVLLKPFF